MNCKNFNRVSQARQRTTHPTYRIFSWFPLAKSLVRRPFAVLQRWTAGQKTPRVKPKKNDAAKAIIELSRMHRKESDFKSADKILKRGRKQHPDHLGLAVEHATIATARKDWAQAACRWERVLDQFEQDAPAIAVAELSCAYRHLSQLSQAEEVLELHRHHAIDARLSIERAEIAMAKKDWAAAAAAGQMALEGLPADSALASRAKVIVSVANRLSHLKEYREAIATYHNRQPTTKATLQASKKIAIYTAIVGNYDSPKLPERLDPHFDYILFTDAPTPETGIWQVRPITYFEEDSTRAARFVKTHPHFLFDECDIAIWIDASIMIIGDIYPLVEDFVRSGRALAAIPHLKRKSVWEEFEACLRLAKDDRDSIQRQADHYTSVELESAELIESNMMIFDLKNECVPRFLDAWWSEIDRFSRRDQLSLNFVLSQGNLEWHRLMQFPRSVRDHPALALTRHDGGVGPAHTLIDALKAPIVDPYHGDSYAEVRDQKIAAQSDRQIDIVVCVHNALEDVERCLESLRLARRNKRHRLIIIDDGSDQVTAEYLETFAHGMPWVELHRSDHPRGYTKAANQGLAVSTGELVILLNSDTIVTDSWAEKLADAVFSTKGAGIVGPMSNAAGHQSIPEHRGIQNQTAINDLPRGLTADDMNRYCEEWTTLDVLPRVPLIYGFCFGVTRDVIDRIGLFNETEFPRGFGEENDYCFRAVDAGFMPVIATHTFLFHAKTKSYASADRATLAAQGSEALARLHGSCRLRKAKRNVNLNPLLSKLRERASGLDGAGRLSH